MTGRTLITEQIRRIRSCKEPLAFRVLSEALGEGRLERMFFIAREPERK